MPVAKKPTFRITYEGQDITEDLTEYVLSISYTDNTEGESDELQLTLDDSDGNWRGAWEPQKGDKIKAEIGYDNALIPCGTFTVDELRFSMPPAEMNIRALAAGIGSPMRTKTSSAFEEQTLEDIAQKIADKHQLTIEGEIPNIQFTRVTQLRETDLAFLKRISKDFGVLFSVRDDKLVFTSIYELEDSAPVVSIDKTDCKRVDITDKTISTFKEANLSYSNSFSNALIGYNFGAIGIPQQRTFTWEYYLAQISFHITNLDPATVRRLYGEKAGDLFDEVKVIVDKITNKIKAGTATKGEAIEATFKVERIVQAEQTAQYYDVLTMSNWVIRIRNARRFLERQNEQNGNEPLLSSPDSLELRGGRVESEQQAESMARASLHQANSNGKEGTLSVEGQPLLLAGSNFNLTGLGRLSGVCQILSSTHDISRGSGYVTSVEFKVIDKLTEDRQN